MDLIAQAHDVLAWVAIFSGGVVGLWATAAHWVEALRGSALWVAHSVFHLVMVVQVAAGAILVGFGGLEADGEHMFYGFLCFVGVGLVIGYRHLSEYRYLLYGLGALFIMGLAIRALTLDPIPV